MISGSSAQKCAALFLLSKHILVFPSSRIYNKRTLRRLKTALLLDYLSNDELYDCTPFLIYLIDIRSILLWLRLVPAFRLAFFKLIGKKVNYFFFFLFLLFCLFLAKVKPEKQKSQKILSFFGSKLKKNLAFKHYQTEPKSHLSAYQGR